MRLHHPTLLLLAALCFQSAPAAAQSWNDIPPAQREALAPLAQEWDKLSEKQQRNFLGIAKRYPKLTPLQQQRI
jgi:hypothetical protein